MNIIKICWSLLIFKLILSINPIYGQNYNTGYADGFREGFCIEKQHNTDKHLGCISPDISAPYLRNTESINNYIDGYIKGLADGVHRKEQNCKSSNIYSGYYISEYKPFTPNLNLYINLIQQKTQSNNVTQKNNIESTKLNYYYSPNDYYSPENIELRKKYSEFIENTYLNYNKLPTKIPNGIFEVTCSMYKNSAQENLYSVHENAKVFIQDNKVIRIDFIYNNEKITLFTKAYFPNLNLEKNESLEELGINNSSNNILNSKAEFYHEFKINNTLFKEMYTIFFNDFIRDYNNCSEKLEKLKQDRATKNLTSKVLDGWINAILTNNNDFFVLRKVFVQNNKVIKWIGDDGGEIYVDGGGEINNLSTTLIKVWPRSIDNILWENTVFYKEQKQVLDVYFE